MKAHKKIWIFIGMFILSLGGYGIYAQTNLFQDGHIISEKLNSQLNDIAPTHLTKKKRDAVVDCDVLIVGGGVSGVAAGIQAGRMGVEVCLLEKGDWAGGMLSSAGVSAVDGHQYLMSGIFKEFVDRVKLYYDSRNQFDDTKKCDVSFLCFEPRVGNKIFTQMIKETKKLRFFTGASVDRVYKKNNKITGVHFVQDGKNFIANSKVLIDATDFGDMMYLADIPYSLGPDGKTDESHSKFVEQCIQPLTYVAILQKQDEFNDFVKIPEPDGYNLDNFKCTVKSNLCTSSNSQFKTVDDLIKYGTLPNNKFMVNIPSHSYGNDFNASASTLLFDSRKDILEKAKNYTLQYVYFLQNELNLPYQLSDEFDTEDLLAKSPYVRESRRLQGVYRLTEPIDLHFCKYGVGDLFLPVKPYQIPYRTLVPKKIDGFLAVGKNISVSHIVNGTTRLQPVVMAVGQAGGAAGALAVLDGVEVRDVEVSKLQQNLISSGSRVVFFNDLDVHHFAYPYVASLAFEGFIHGFSDSSFKPDYFMMKTDFISMFVGIMNNVKNGISWRVIVEQELSYVDGVYLTRGEVAHLIVNVMFDDEAYRDFDDVYFDDVGRDSIYFDEVEFLADKDIISKNNSSFFPNRYITRGEAITIVARALSFWGK